MSISDRKVVVIFNNRLPTEKAHGMQIAKMCEAFALLGVSTELWVPEADNHIEEDIFEYYKLKNNFLVKKIKCINLSKKLFSSGFIYRFRYLTFLASLILTKKRGHIFLTRHPEVVFLLSLFGHKVFFENHNWYSDENKIKKNLFLVKKTVGVIVTTKEIKKEFLKNGFTEDKILVAPNGVDLDKFSIGLKKEEARRKLALPQERRIVLYTGHLYKKKGIYTLVDAAKELPSDFMVLIVGGNPGDIKKIKEYTSGSGIKNVSILGHKKHEEIPLYLKSADILAITNSGEYDSESKYTCPLKLFEYLAAGKVILASNVPSLREFVSKDEVVFFESDNPEDLAEKIKKISENRGEQEKLIKNSKQKSQAFTWQKRAGDILRFVDS